MNLTIQLQTFAQQLLDGVNPTTVARDLQAIAARNPVALPTIDAKRDGTLHWQQLTDEQLRNENSADAWNLAAGLHEEQRRKAAARAKLRDDITQLASTREQAS